MMPIRTITGVVVAQSGVALLARILGNSGQPVSQSTFSSIQIVITNLTSGVTGSPIAQTVAAAVFNSLVQNDPRWQKDSADNPGPDGHWGYNFLAILPAVNFALAQATPPASGTFQEPAPILYQADAVFTPVTGEPFRVPFRFTALPAYG